MNLGSQFKGKLSSVTQIAWNVLGDANPPGTWTPRVLFLARFGNQYKCICCSSTLLYLSVRPAALARVTPLPSSRSVGLELAG